MMIKTFDEDRDIHNILYQEYLQKRDDTNPIEFNVWLKRKCYQRDQQVERLLARIYPQYYVDYKKYMDTSQDGIIYSFETFLNDIVYVGVYDE